METVTCMSLEEMEWSISIEITLEEIQECGDVIYLIVMVYIRVSTSTLAFILQVFIHYQTVGRRSLGMARVKSHVIRVQNGLKLS